jgi:hypothetical protein
MRSVVVVAFARRLANWRIDKLMTATQTPRNQKTTAMVLKFQNWLLKHEMRQKNNIITFLFQIEARELEHKTKWFLDLKCVFVSISVLIPNTCNKA